MVYLEGKLAEAKEKIGTLIIRTTVDRATIEIDGAYRWDYPHLVEIYVEPEKEHKIVARREGYWTAYTTEKVSAGETKDVLMAMEPQVMQRGVNLPTRVMASVGSGNPPPEESKTLLYVSAAGLGISLAAGIVGAMILYSGEKKRRPGDVHHRHRARRRRRYRLRALDDGARRVWHDPEAPAAADHQHIAGAGEEPGGAGVVGGVVGRPVRGSLPDTGFELVA
jgi:hypothetical protein